MASLLNLKGLRPKVTQALLVWVAHRDDADQKELQQSKAVLLSIASSSSVILSVPRCQILP